MIIDSDQHPEKNIYFIGANLIKILSSSKDMSLDIYSVFLKYNKESKTKISFDYLLLGMDWLFLLNLIEVNPKGDLKKCF